MIQEAYDECMYDVCVVPEERDDMLCSSLAQFVSRCNENDYFYNWRTPDLCREFNKLLNIFSITHY